jgi:hypothetical protein
MGPGTARNPPNLAARERVGVDVKVCRFGQESRSQHYLGRCEGAAQGRIAQIVRRCEREIKDTVVRSQT